MGRPTTAVETWAFGCRQLFAGGRSGTAALLQQPCGENRQVFAVTGDFWELYLASGDLAPIRYGLPLGRRGDWKGGSTQGFGRGGGFQAYFMQRPGMAPRVVVSPLLEHFLSFDDRDTRFGYPTSDLVRVVGGQCQRFEGAALIARDEGARHSFIATDGGCEGVS
jgi:hypothetical protein